MNKIFFVVTILLFGFTINVKANEIRELNLAEKVNKSDNVFIGRVLRIDISRASSVFVGKSKFDIEQKYTEVSIQDNLKGNLNGTIQVQYKSGISELDPACCVIEETYLFFVRKAEDGSYIPINGPFSVYGLKKNNYQHAE